MHAAEEVQFDRQKFLAAVHYVCARQSAEDLGRFKLHKTLYLAEFLTFLETGIPLCGAEYVKQQAGPLARQLGWAIGELETAGKLEVVDRVFAGYPKTDFVSKIPPDTTPLSHSEVRLLDKVSDFVSGRGARELDELDYEATWEPIAYGDVVPYWMALSLVPCEVTERDIEWAKGEARELGLIGN